MQLADGTLTVKQWGGVKYATKTEKDEREDYLGVRVVFVDDSGDSRCAGKEIQHIGKGNESVWLSKSRYGDEFEGWRL